MTALPATDARPEQIARAIFPPRPTVDTTLEAARSARNKGWKGNPLIPSWVQPEKVDLDRFFTRPAVAQECHLALLDAIASDHADAARYKFVDPAAGDGVFYDLLPVDRRIGIEIVPGRVDLKARDYLGWNPRANGHRYAVIGNPPFGYRAWLALAFVNHSATFADYIGLILPMAFQSDGKGRPKFRVEGAQLIQSAPLPQDSFLLPSGRPAAINALWQVWRRGVNNRATAPSPRELAGNATGKVRGTSALRERRSS